MPKRIAFNILELTEELIMSWTPKSEDYERTDGSHSQAGLKSYAQDLVKSNSSLPDPNNSPLNYADRQAVQREIDNQSK